MKWNNIKTTIFKELRGVVRDKKSIQKIVLYPLIIPFIIFLFGFLFEGINESKYEVGINYQLTSEEKMILKEIDNLSFNEYSDEKELEEAYKDKEISGYIVKDNNKYTIYTDLSGNSGEIITSLATTYLEAYNKMLGDQYLISKGIDPNKSYNNIIIDSKSLKDDKSNVMTTTMFSLIISYMIMIVLLVCMIVVIDATSGEKERGTLETILTFPIKSSELVIGKYLASTSLGFLMGTIAYLLSMPSFLIAKKMFKSYDEIVVTINAKSIILVIFVILLTALLAAGVCMALSGKAKTYKEAQSSLQLVSFLPIIPYFLQIMETQSTILNIIPIANCVSLLNDIIINSINYKSLLLIIVSTIVYIFAILKYISKQYSKEETLFS